MKKDKESLQADNKPMSGVDWVFSLQEKKEFNDTKSIIPLFLGLDDKGKPVFCDFGKCSNMLIGGRTGAGKSVFLYLLLMSIVFKFKADECKVIIYDPCGVDFFWADGMPHLLTPVIRMNPKQTIEAMKWLVQEMDVRSKKCRVMNVIDIQHYNEKIKKLGQKPLPQIIFIIDEIADFVQDFSDAFVGEISECFKKYFQILCRRAHRMGIHLILVTQCPDWIPMWLKPYVPFRVAFQTREIRDSVQILGERGAENLAAHGEMLFGDAGRDPIKIKVPLISDQELDELGKFIPNWGQHQYVYMELVVKSYQTDGTYSLVPLVDMVKRYGGCDNW